MQLSFDVLIVGSGLAGLTAALSLPTTLQVAIVTKGAIQDGASSWAQGGIAAVFAKDDSLQSHIDDTLYAGAGLSDVLTTRFVVGRARQSIEWLQGLGVPFSQENGQLHLTREGGHSARRVVHAQDATGAAVQNVLIESVSRRSNIHLFEQHTLVDVITVDKRCLGLYALDEASGRVLTFSAPHTLLATGGAGKVFLHSTNPDTATGDGIAAAWRAGCRVGNMEFIQFHPTTLYHPEAQSFLISEALRGEGGVLVLPKSAGGQRFMPRYDPRAELAPRDVVAKSIDFEMKKHGLDCVYLDISHQPTAFIQEHFPNIYDKCLALGIDIARQPIPVVPAAHYTCGGIMVDLCGHTDIAGLYAIGETADTGLHGANRLASNSLLECLVFARAAVDDIVNAASTVATELPAWEGTSARQTLEAHFILRSRQDLRQCMWEAVGIVRTDQGLAHAALRVQLWLSQLRAREANICVTRDSLELRNLMQVADLIIRSAQLRRESRGLHFSADHPNKLEVAKPTMLTPP